MLVLVCCYLRAGFCVIVLLYSLNRICVRVRKMSDASLSIRLIVFVYLFVRFSLECFCCGSWGISEMPGKKKGSVAMSL